MLSQVFFKIYESLRIVKSYNLVRKQVWDVSCELTWNCFFSFFSFLLYVSFIIFHRVLYAPWCEWNDCLRKLNIFIYELYINMYHRCPSSRSLLTELFSTELEARSIMYHTALRATATALAHLIVWIFKANTSILYVYCILYVHTYLLREVTVGSRSRR